MARGPAALRSSWRLHAHCHGGPSASGLAAQDHRALGSRRQAPPSTGVQVRWPRATCSLRATRHVAFQPCTLQPQGGSGHMVRTSRPTSCAGPAGPRAPFAQKETVSPRGARAGLRGWAVAASARPSSVTVQTQELPLGALTGSKLSHSHPGRVERGPRAALGTSSWLQVGLSLSALEGGRTRGPAPSGKGVHLPRLPLRPRKERHRHVSMNSVTAPLTPSSQQGKDLGVFGKQNQRPRSFIETANLCLWLYGLPGPGHVQAGHRR